MASDIIGKLRDEILNSQKSRLDLFRWKIVLVAGLGATAIGLVPNNPGRIEIVGLVPWVCVLVDVVCYHTELGIMLIAAFFRQLPPAEPAKDYENFCQANRDIFSLEGSMIAWTTVLPCIAVLAVGLLMRVTPRGAQIDSRSCILAMCLVLSGGLGITVWLFFRWTYNNRKSRLADAAFRLSLKTRIVRSLTLLVLAFGTGMLSYSTGSPTPLVRDHVLGWITPRCT